MKKFISLLIASAMVVSLVPATAFAGSDVSATAKVVGSETITEGSATSFSTGAELQLKIADAAYSGTDADTTASTVTMEIEVTIDDAEFPSSVASTLATWEDETGTTSLSNRGASPSITTVRVDDDELLITVTGMMLEDDLIRIPLIVDYDLDAGDYATVSVDSDMVEADDLVFLSCEDKGIEASVDDIVYVAEDEGTTLDDLVIEELVDGTFTGAGQILVLELSKGFEFGSTVPTTKGVSVSSGNYKFDDEYAYFAVTDDAKNNDEITIDGLYIYADDADEGDICTMEITLYNGDSSSVGSVKSSDKVAECEVEVAEVCDYTVTISVDEDDDVPVFYNGVNVDNEGLNDGSDHMSLLVTIEESFPGAWSYRDSWELTLPEGVYVTGVDFDDTDISWVNAKTSGYSSDSEYNFAVAYQDGDYEGFEFSKRIFDETTGGDEIVLSFELELVAAPDFEGEVVLGFVGDAVTEDEVVIAEFVSPYTVEASQNDVIIDYRNTSIDTPVVITEAEAELWSDEMVFYFSMEGSYIDFDSEGEVTVDDESSMEVDVDSDSAAATIEITIDEESDDEAAVLTWEGIELYMNRTLAAGPYALDMYTSASVAFMAEIIFAYDTSYSAESDEVIYYVGDVINGSDSGDYTKGTISSSSADGYEIEVCENFVNVVTAGSDQATTFTTTVIVPIGESFIYSGGTQIELDVPAYISADGYTMLPVRAVATAIGVSTSNVLWNGDAQQVTIIYGTKTIAMVIGQSYMTVNGTAIPTDAVPEIVDGRTFLPLRDLATALSVTNITWDADTRTAQLN